MEENIRQRILRYALCSLLSLVIYSVFLIKWRREPTKFKQISFSFAIMNEV